VNFVVRKLEHVSFFLLSNDFLEMLMPYTNVQNLLYLNELDFPFACSRTMVPAEFKQKYQVRPDGVNLYLGVEKQAVDRVKETGSALEPDMVNVLDALIADFQTGGKPYRYVDVSLEPIQTPNPFEFVNDNLNVVTAVANDLAGYQAKASAIERELRVVIRYASEMNDPTTCSQPYGRPVDASGVGLPHEPHAAAFVESYKLVRTAMKTENESLLFAFSPAIRYDIIEDRYTMLADYFPGNDIVDRISCTWYTASSVNITKSKNVMKRYFNDFKVGFDGTFGIDEMGGVDEDTIEAYNRDVIVEHDNDRILTSMFDCLQELADSGVAFETVSVFLLGKWGVDAKLTFLSPAVGQP